jgi:sulfur carrier protein ThiS
VTVTIIMHGTLRRFLPDGAARATLDLRAGATIEEVLVGLGAEQDTWVVARNQAVAERDAVLAPGDVLDCFEPVSGGSQDVQEGPSASLAPRPHAQRTESTPRVRLSGAASHLDLLEHPATLFYPSEF